jgi:GT2 family glycosyltransferase
MNLNQEASRNNFIKFDDLRQFDLSYKLLTQFNFRQHLDSLKDQDSINIKSLQLSIDGECLTIDNNYEFEFKNRSSSKKNLIIICTQNNEEILEYTLSKITNSSAMQFSDILVVDDRSSSGRTDELCRKLKCSYLRINNTLDLFNFSILNNIACLFAKKLKSKTITLWNDDVFIDDKNTLNTCLYKHFLWQSPISGIRLLYPNDDICKKLNLKTPSKYRDTIQHGGMSIMNHHSHIAAEHSYRFEHKNRILANIDIPTLAVTGAFSIINLEDFIKIGGLNPSLSSLYQDVDLCLRFSLIKKQKPMYLGSEYMYHAESISLLKDQKLSDFFKNDQQLFNKIWTQPAKQ